MQKLEKLITDQKQNFLRKITCGFCGSRDFANKTVEFGENTYSCQNCGNSTTKVLERKTDDFRNNL